jgi:hypothetical protein
MAKKYRLYSSGQTVEVENADGTEGFLLQGLGGKMWFRIYDKDRNFKDYPIRHHDMKIKIIDSGVYFYRTEDGKAYLDYSPSALGYEENE